MKPYVELSIQGIQCGEVTALRGTEHVSTLFEYEIEVMAQPPVPDLSTLMGARAEIIVRDVAGQQRVVTGIVSEASVVGADTDLNVRGRFVVRPAVYRQTLGRDCWSSQDVTVMDVVKAVLEDYPGPVRYDLVGDYPTYPYRVQYREDDWTYVSRLLEEEGIFYWFDHGDGESELVFGDNSPAGPPIDGVPLMSFTPASQMRPDQDAVVEVSFSGQATSHRFSARSYDLVKPTVRIAAQTGAGRHEVYDAPGAGPADPSVLQERVRVGLESAQAHRRSVRGLATSVRLFPGRFFQLFNHPVAALGTELFVTGIELLGDAKVGISTRFTAIERKVPYRSLRTTKEAKQPGIQMGVVVGPAGEEVHPDNLGRVRVQLHWDRLGSKDEKAGTWMRIAQRGSPGSMLLPRMGWNVSTFNEEGTVDAPSLFCRIHDGDHPPEYALPANKTRVVYKTATTPKAGTFNEIYFEDKGGSEEMFIHASRDMHVRAQNRKFELVKNDSLRDVGAEYELHVTADMVDRVMQDQTVSVGGNEELVAQGRYTKTVSQNETRTISASRTLKVGDAYTTSVDKDRTLQAASMIDMTLGTISTTANDASATVGGLMMRVAGGNITEDTVKIGNQLVGAAKLEFAKENRPLDVKETFTESVYGAMTMQSNGRWLDNADTTSDWLMLGSMNADAPKVRIEAEEKITIQCGNSRLIIDQREIRIEAENLDLSGAHIDADTSLIKHN